MEVSNILDSLSLPPECMLERRIPKKVLLEQDLPTTTDKKQVREFLEAIILNASIQPGNAGITGFKDDTKEYQEIAIVHLQVRAGGNSLRLSELLHRLIPYPLFLITEYEGSLFITLAHKRWSQAEKNKVVIENEFMLTENLEQSNFIQEFLSSLSLDKQRRTNLYELYSSWMEKLEALHAAKYTGYFSLFAMPADSEKRSQALKELENMDSELKSLRAKIKKEKQINRRVELNIQIKELEKQISKLKKDL